MERQETEASPRQEIQQNLPTTPREVNTAPEQLASRDANGTDGYVHTNKTADEDVVGQESAELFLVFGGETEDERGAKVLDLSRPELCRLLGLETDAVDEVIWEKLGMKFEEIAQERQS
jgi:hypothetical protein